MNNRSRLCKFFFFFGNKSRLCKPSGSMKRDDSSVVVDVRAMRIMGFKKYLKGIDSSDNKSKVDKYLAEILKMSLAANCDIYC